MFSSSTHRKSWIFRSEDEVIQQRRLCRDRFVLRRCADPADDFFLTYEDTEVLLKHFERKLLEFCVKFVPTMPRSVRDIAFIYFKRFYLHNSVMDYHPKEILVTAAFLACKVDEFNVSLEQFVYNINGNKERAMEIILNHELLLMAELRFHLTVHTAWRPLEGILIDVKTRLTGGEASAIEALRPEIERFLTEVNFTNAYLTYAPSQIALAAVIHSASKQGYNLDSYVTDILFGDESGKKNLHNIIEAVRNIRLMVKNVAPPASLPAIKSLSERLEKCRNQDNNPDSQAYKRKLLDMLDDDDERASKLAKIDEDHHRMGFTKLA